MTAPVRRHLLTVLVVMGAWAGNALFFVQQQVLAFAMTGETAPTDRLYRAGFRTAAIWASFTLLLLFLGPARRLRDRPVLVTIGVHVVLALVLNGIDVTIDRATNQLLGFQGAYTLGGAYFSQLNGNFFSYCVVAATLHALDYARLSRERALQAERLLSQLSQARLELLKMQLQPHFLFNTLHATAGLVHSDPHAAERMILRLGDLLRAAVAHGERPVVTVREELELLQAYLDIQQIRFRERLSVTMRVENGLQNAEVPNLLLQPLVENAIKHGAAKQLGPASIQIAIRRVHDMLVLEVVNSGPLPPSAESGLGLGLRNTRARLDALYDGKHAFDLALHREGGATATIRIPFREVD